MSLRNRVPSSLAGPALACLLGATACVSAVPPNTCERNSDCETPLLCKDGQCTAIPCRGACDSDEICIEERCVGREGLSCVNDATVCGRDFQCSPGGVCQRKCALDDECTDSRFPVCNVDTGYCGDCSFDQDCTDPNRPFCDTRTAICVRCIDARGCYVDGAPAGQYCDLTTNTCQAGCKSNGDCKLGQRCDGGSPDVVGRCIECRPDPDPDPDPLSDSECDLANPRLHCDPDRLVCVQCLDDAHCMEDQTCDRARNQCVECLRNQDCDPARFGEAGVVCNQTTLTCVPGCLGGLGGPNCPAATPACDPTPSEEYPAGRCVECLRDSDCPQTGKVCDESTKRCIDGCTDNTRCGGTRPYCRPDLGPNGTCVQCLTDTNCPNGLLCHQGSTPSTTGVCRCKGVGELCGASTECGFGTLTQAESWNPDGTPDCTRTAGEICITHVRCEGSGTHPVTPICSRRGTGALPERGQKGNCPEGYIIERAADASGQFEYQCVPATRQYDCRNL